MINKEYLQELTRKAQERMVREKEEQTEENTRQIELEAQKLAAAFIRLLPSTLEHEAGQGKNSAHVMGDYIRTPAEKKAAEIVAQHCRNAGLKAEVLPNKSDGSSSYLLVSWENGS